LTDPAANGAVIAQVTSSTKEKAAPPVVTEPKPLVIRTGAVSTAMVKIDTAYSKNEKPAKQVKSSAN
jgi:hypothetical protein